MSTVDPYPASLLPDGIRSRFLENVNGLRTHILEAGYASAGRPLILLMHGFPELAYSWRHVMLPLAAQGYHVVAPDLRGFGRTTGGDHTYNCDLTEFSYLNKVRDALALVQALGQAKAAMIVGHDLGSIVAAMGGLVRPDVFQSVVIMSAPYPGPPRIDVSYGEVSRRTGQLARDLAALPRPRKYYLMWNTTPDANENYTKPQQGLHDFFRAYFHSKSGDWAGNNPVALKAQTAAEMAQVPTYYVMDLAAGMAETVAEMMPSRDEIARCQWFTESDVEVFAAEYGRTGFQGALNASYRILTDGRLYAEGQTFAGRTIDVPSAFICGARDWGLRQTAGAFEAMPVKGFSRMIGCHLVEGAGHWVQQERHREVTRLLIDFLGKLRG